MMEKECDSDRGSTAEGSDRRRRRKVAIIIINLSRSFVCTYTDALLVMARNYVTAVVVAADGDSTYLTRGAGRFRTIEQSNVRSASL